MKATAASCNPRRLEHHTPLTSNTEWERWGKEDPLWSVASWPGRQKTGPNPWSRDDFYALGKSDWNDFRLRWRRYGLETRSCVEIGCGAGRITAQLIHDFEIVHALDVSTGMLEYARRAIRGAQFHVTDGVHIPLPDASVSAVFSCHVLQHLDSPEAVAPILQEIHRVLLPDSSIMLHLPIYCWPASPRIFDRLFRIRQAIARWKAAMYRRCALPVMRGTWYEIVWLEHTLKNAGFEEIEFLYVPVQSNGSLHSFALARKCRSKAVAAEAKEQ